ncbi:MAG: DNA mismatch repair endonuclease MutL [Proteobacteria bacterium]|nr:DNA mismatch repair endonuclease MutL [Candidatus Enterousia scatequi]
MSVRVLPDFLINQIAAGEVVERPASVVKELVENALDAGATQILIDVVDGGRTLISVIDNGVGMTQDDLIKSVSRHATSKLPTDDLLNISYMGFRGEALPSIASVSDMTIDTYHAGEANGWHLDVNTGAVKPCDWENGTRIRVQNLFAKTPARLKFLRGDRAELISIVDVVKMLAMSRRDVGFVLNNKWRFAKDETLNDRMIAVMGDDVDGHMLPVDASSESSNMKLTGFISDPTLHRASSVDQYLFVNNRAVKDKVLVGALRAAYMDVMHAREFPLCALFLTLPTNMVDVNVSPSKTEVHFLEPTHVRGFIVKSLRDTLGMTLQSVMGQNIIASHTVVPETKLFNKTVVDNFCSPKMRVSEPVRDIFGCAPDSQSVRKFQPDISNDQLFTDYPLGHAIGQIGNKYIIAEKGDNLIIVDQHAAHERITYQRLYTHEIKAQPLLTPIVINMKNEDAMAVLSIADEMKQSGLVVDSFGDDAVAIFEKPSDWDLNWADLFKSIADEVRTNGHSSQLGERLHLKLANFACHHSVRAGQKLNLMQMDALLRDIEKTEHGGECNHGRPVYKIIPFADLDSMFERS